MSRMSDRHIDERILIDAELHRRADEYFLTEIPCDGCGELRYPDEMSRDPDTPHSVALYCEDCMPNDDDDE